MLLKRINMIKNKPMFERIRKSNTVKLLMAFTAINLLAQIVFPSVAMALTAGSASPEFASFEPVATTDMVNDFTGDFTYNLPVLSVPGPDGGGYSMSLSYHSGGSSEEESSWVGHGWTLNPGAINRQKRGFADDFKGVAVKSYNKQYPNWTEVAGFNINLELNSSDKKKDDKKKDDKKDGEGGASKKALKFVGGGINGFGGKKKDDKKDGDDDESAIQPSVSFSKSIRYNNYSGFSITTGFGVGVKGMGSLNMNKTGGESTLGFTINPLAILSAAANKKKKKNKDETEKSTPEAKPSKFKKVVNGISKLVSAPGRATRGNINIPTSYTARSYNAPAVPYSVAYNVGTSYNFSMSLGIELWTVGVQFGIQGSINYQANRPLVNKSAYGYMYNPPLSKYKNIQNKKYDHVVKDGREIVDADFQIEKGSTFGKHDKYLGIPFNTADIFTATGSGVVGGFKFYHNQIGHYYPTFIKNKQSIKQTGGEVAIGQTIAIGIDLGLGFQSTVVQDWRAIEGDDAPLQYPQYTGADKPTMAFSGDMGGQVDYSGDDKLLNATVGGGYMNRKLAVTNFNADAPALSGATTTTTKTVLDQESDRKTSNVKYTRDAGGELLKTIEVTNKEGNVSVYGNPVYTQEEYELTVGLPEKLNDFDGANENYAVPSPASFDVTNPLKEKTAVGQYIKNKYASTFLLTENRTFDYVDVNGNGADELDFGGWTKFDYRLAHSDYQYRSPYTGVIYNEGRMIDGNDQSGSVSTGQKEVKYLSEIETKTHIAFFITNKTLTADFAPTYSGLDLNGSTIERTDGVDAERDAGGLGTHYVEKLERIVLYAKKDLSKPISTTYMTYDYALCKGIPNSTTASNGKLTLKKVWTESGGTIKSKIAPYQFEYDYHIYTEDEIVNTTTGKYPDINAGYELLASIDQNPLYQEGMLDPWGSYRKNAKERFKNKQAWVDQGTQNDSFDPAAWQLKQIKLPSGGQIDIQYEQKDYRFVQDKAAMGMAPLLLNGGTGKAVNGYSSGKFDNQNPKNAYYINLDAIGAGHLSGTALDPYVEQLKMHFVTLKNKLYFKMLYSYTGASPNLNVHRHDVDYITGYTAVNNVVREGNNIYFELGELNSKGKGKKDKTLPRYVGYKKFLVSSHRNLGWHARDVDKDDDDMLAAAYDNSPDFLDNGKIQNESKKLLVKNTFNFFKDWTGGLIKNRSIKDICKNYNADLSYFKIPLPNAKRGGGTRVKRLISYDPGIAGETGDAMIYGSEYIYKNTNGLSSGVATNEPQTIREENALVGILEQNKQSGWDKTFNGKDSKEFEGPIGESLMPGASVVHERVIVKNIHSGKTTTGYAVNNYHTVRTNPMVTDFSELSKSGGDPTYKKYNLSLPLGMINLSYNKAWVTQGYLFKLNDMHGKLESQATYAGDYARATYREAAFTSKTTYAYSKPGEAVETLVYNASSNDFELGKLRLGQEEDITMYRSRVRDVTNDFSIELDINFLLQVYPTVTIGFGLSYSYTQNELSQHVTSKVLRQKSLLLSTTTTTDGVTQVTQNIAFDKNTGDPVLTKTYDGYMDKNEQIKTKGGVLHDGHYYALNIPASWMYPTMGQQDVANPNNSNQLTASVGNVVTYGSSKIANEIANIPQTIDQTTGFITYETLPVTSPFANDKIVNASATVYKKDWFLDLALTAPVDQVDKDLLNQHYYPQRTYVYRDQVSDANASADGKIYKGGLIATNFDFFTWENISNNDFYTSDLEALIPIDKSMVGSGLTKKWYSASEIKAYSENGYPIEEQDVLGIYSAAKFGYSATLPVLVAQNAKQDQVYFIDFEVSNDQGFPNVTTSAHSGNGAFDLQANPNQVFFNQYNFDSPLMARGVTIKLWLKSALSNNPGSSNFGMRNSAPNLQAEIGSQTFSFKRIAQTGDWSLYTANITNFSGLTPGPYNVQLNYSFNSNIEEVLIDDVRIQPLDAVMNCTVYNKDNKVSAQFDDQHFGVYYEYNNKEQLVRKRIETERGKKTLQEQQYNTPLINRFQ